MGISTPGEDLFMSWSRPSFRRFVCSIRTSESTLGSQSYPIRSNHLDVQFTCPSGCWMLDAGPTLGRSSVPFRNEHMSFGSRWSVRLVEENTPHLGSSSHGVGLMFTALFVRFQLLCTSWRSRSVNVLPILCISYGPSQQQPMSSRVFWWV